MTRKFFKLLVLLFFIVSIVYIPKVHAQMGWGMMGNYNSSNASQAAQQKVLDDVTNALLKSQKVNTIGDLDCSKISQDEFEKLGDAWMGEMAGSEANHSAMEQRMGGEGSESLKQVHIRMGENYLGCNANGIQRMYGYQNTASRGGGFPMMGWGGYGYGGMNGLGFGFGWLALLLWLVAFIDLILLGIWLWQHVRTPKKK